jgi:hypothetical protein
VRLSVRLVQVETGEILGGVNETGTGAADLPKLASRAAARIGRTLRAR